jgi:hypothetical protein
MHPAGLTARFLPALLALTPAGAQAAGTESIEFVTEHLPEIAMDNRYASLPLWAPRGPSVTLSYASLRSGELSLNGPALAVGFNRRVGEAWTLGLFGFIDDLRFSGGPEQRPLEVSFARAVPLALPAAAEFTNLSGASAGAAGTLDYSASYTHFAPFAGIAWPRDHGQWAFTPHAQIAMPLPRRGVVGRITGSAFDIRGDAASVGNGKHFGDPSLTLGFDVSYQPWHLTLDVGTTVSQYLLEPLTHEGVNQTWLISLRWAD